MKISARKNVSTNKSLVKGTGGGPRPGSPSPEDINIVDLLNPGELLRDSNIYDSDGPVPAPDSQPDIIIVENTENDSQVGSQPEIILVGNLENDSQVTLSGSQPNNILLENMDNVNPAPSTSAIRPFYLHLAKSASRKILKTPSRNARNPMLANTPKVSKEYINEMVNHSKSLKDAEHKIKMEILKQNLLNAQSEGELLKLKKILLEMEVKAKTIV